MSVGPQDCYTPPTPHPTLVRQTERQRIISRQQVTTSTRGKMAVIGRNQCSSAEETWHDVTAGCRDGLGGTAWCLIKNNFFFYFLIYDLYWRSHRHDIIWEPQISKNYQNPPTNKTFRRKKTSFHLTRLAGPFLLTAVTSTCLTAHDIQLSFSISEHILVPYIGHELVL